MKWGAVTLEELCSVSKGKKHIEVERSSDVYRYIQIDDLHGGSMEKYTSEVGTVAEKTDVLIAWDGANAGKVGVGFRGMIGSTLARLRPKVDGIESRFLYWFLESKFDLIKSQRTGATIPHVNGPMLRQLTIPLPPLPVQKQIADTLDKADALRKKDQLLLRKYDDLAQSIFYEMFGDPERNDKGWKKGQLGSYIDYIGDIGSNGSNEVVAKNLIMTNVPDYAIMIRTTNLNSNDFEKNLKYVSKTTYDFFSKSQIFGGEIIMNKIGSAGDFWIMPHLNKPVSLGLNQLVIRLKNLNTRYLFHYLSTNYGKSTIKANVRGAVTKSITKSAVKELPLLYPSLALQNEFAKRIECVENQRKMGEINSSNSNALFCTYLNHYFS